MWFGHWGGVATDGVLILKQINELLITCTKYKCMALHISGLCNAKRLC